MNDIYIESAAARSPLGNNLDEIWSNILAGKSTYSKATLPGENVYFAAECEEGSASDISVYSKLYSSTIVDLVGQLNIDEHVEAVFFATAVGNLAEIESDIYKGNSVSGNDLDFANVKNVFHEIDHITSNTKIITIPTGCCAGMQAIGLARRVMDQRNIKSAVIMSLDFGLTPLAFSAFSMVNATKTFNDDTQESPSRPFCKERGGFLFADGGGALYVKTNPSNKNVPKITGYGCVSSAFHMIDICTDGASIRKSIELALDEAKVNPCDIDHVNLHASGTMQNDEAEYQALLDVIGENIPDITTYKGNHGHALGGANIIEIALTWKMLLDGKIPPTPKGIPFDAFEATPPRQEPRDFQSHAVLKTASGFSGIHASLVMEY